MTDFEFRHYLEQELKMEIITVQGSGDKLYEALSLWKFGTEGRALDLRQVIMSELIENEEVYANLMKNASLPDTILKIHNNELAAGELELVAASRALRINTFVYKPLTNGALVFPPKQRFKAKVYLAYHSNRTFSLLVPNSNATD